MKRLLQIGSSCNYGAPGKIAEQIGQLAQTHGWEVYMAHGNKYKNPSELYTFQTVTPFQEHLHEAYSVLFDGHGLASDKETRKLCKWIKEVNPDVIHLHNIHGYFLNYRILFEYLSKLDKPVIWTLHDFWPITGHCAHFDYIKCFKWKTECRNCDHFHDYPFSISDHVKRNYHYKKEAFTSVRNLTLVSVSNWVASEIKESFLRTCSCRVIYNGVDLKTFKYVKSNLRQKYNIENKRVLIGVAAPWKALKGYNDYFLLRQELTDEYVLVMVGLTKKQISCLPQGVVGVERTQNQEELAEYYSMADVVLNLSYQETFGMTTVEGMACGTPGIVYNKTASPELVSPETGRVVEAGNMNALVGAIQDLVTQDRETQRIRCMERAKELFDKNKCFSQYVELYDELIR